MNYNISVINATSSINNNNADDGIRTTPSTITTDPITISATSSTTRKIKPLSKQVINRIAAGEVIQRPANALKELLENSLDANSRTITVTVKQGGLKLLQITDDGDGIAKEDLDIVCERFTTSKLTKFEDLQNINTFGFRGEALASITHVAHLTIISKTKDQQCAFKAKYCDGKLVPFVPGEPAEPKPSAGVKGTTITVEDLFYNVAARKNALKSPSDEYARILTVVQRYAIHNAGISITLKKAGESGSDVHTLHGSSVLENIRTIYGGKLARELLEIKTPHYLDSNNEQNTSDTTTMDCDDGNNGNTRIPSYKRLRFSVHGYFSNANYNQKKSEFILFINKRLVECNALKKALESVYSKYLPKNTHPFMYLSLMIDPRNVDVNVHPTKAEVHFLHEDEIIEEIQAMLEDKLLGANSSRTFYTQTPLPGANLVSLMESPAMGASSTQRTPAPTPSKQTPIRGPISQEKEAPSPAYKVVRTDENSQVGQMELYLEKRTSNNTSQVASGTTQQPDDTDGHKRKKNTPQELLSELSKKRRANETTVELTSVREVLAELQADSHEAITNIFKHHTFVGWVNAKYSLIQHQTSLYLVDVESVSTALMYQLVFNKFSRFRKIRLSQTPNVYQLVLNAIEYCLDDSDKAEIGDPEGLARYISDRFVSRADMLDEYFSIKIDDQGRLCSLPQILNNYVPPLHRLPLFLLRLGTEVNWDEEKPCFESIAQELSMFYCLPQDDEIDEGGDTEGENSNSSGSPPKASSSSSSSSNSNKAMSKTNLVTGYNKETLSWVTQHVLFPCCRLFFAPPKRFATDGTVVQVACVENLYKIFERC